MFKNVEENLNVVRDNITNLILDQKKQMNC